jgi:hypothetical protein
MAQTLVGSDPGPAINASESNLTDYLNQPVQSILGRLGVPHLPQAAATPDPADSHAPPAGAGNSGMPGMLTNLLTQMIQPVTDALGMLGSGSFGNLDPTQMLGGISQAMESAGQQVQPAMAGLGAAWQGSASSAAGAKTSAALENGTQVANQSTALQNSLSTAVASVQQAQAQLVAILNEYSATIAAIGPNIIFPWGMAQAIAAANQAVTSATAVMTELQSTLATEEANTTAVGTPVSVTSVPQAGSTLAASVAPSAATSASRFGTNLAATPGAAAGAPAALASAPAALASAPAAAASTPASSFAPMLMQAAMPAMQGVGAATSAIQAGGQGGPAGAAAPGTAADATGGGTGAAGRAAAGGGAGTVAPGGISPETIASRLAEAPSVPTTDVAPASMNTDAVAHSSMGGAPLMGGAPMGAGARAGAGRSHSAAAFLHTSDQGDEIVGDLGSVAPAVLGHTDPVASPDIELRI